MQMKLHWLRWNWTICLPGRRIKQFKPGHLHMAVHRGFHEICVHLVGLVLLVIPGLKKKPDHFQVAFVAQEG